MDHKSQDYEITDITQKWRGKCEILNIRLFLNKLLKKKNEKQASNIKQNIKTN